MAIAVALGGYQHVMRLTGRTVIGRLTLLYTRARNATRVTLLTAGFGITIFVTPLNGRHRGQMLAI